MFLPIGDDTPREKTPYVNYAFIALNVLAFIAFCVPEPTDRALRLLALDPFEFSIPTIFTSLFLHAGPLSLAANLLFLWLFGDNVEDKLGHATYLAFYLVAGAASALLHVATSSATMIGASGAVSGVVAAYAVFFPRNRVKIFAWHVPALFWIGFWFLLQFLYGVRPAAASAGAPSLGFIGGFTTGLAVAAVWKFLLFPRRFGLHGGEEPYPAELVAPSRNGDWTSPVSTPFVTLERDGSGPVDRSPHAKFAILRAGDNLAHLGEIARTVLDDAGIPSGRTIERLRTSRGVVARGLDRAASERIRTALRQKGLRTLLVPDDASSQPPVPAKAQTLTWDELSFSCVSGNEMVRVLWPMPFLYLGAQAGGRPLIDIFVSPRCRVRVTEDTSLRFPEEQHPEGAPTLRALAAAILDLRRGAALNDGLRVLASRGSWGWLSFRDEPTYEDYAFWAYNVILARQPLNRF